jgi:FtsP/CotA-like multicopper oxidase with cupredoxin domain
MKKINRRQFVTLSLASAGGAIFTSCMRSNSSQTAQKVSLKEAIDLPKLHKSNNGLLELDLEASYRPITLGNKQAYLLAYNGQVPGPRLEANPGDTVRIRFTNNLSNPTNIHQHGLHIPPTGNADNVFLNIQPKERFNYEFTIPKNHPGGIFWYHPHRHGLVAEQLFGGLAGLFVVRGELDKIPEIKAAKEEFLVLQDFALDYEGKLINSSAHMSLMLGREGNLITVNGQPKHAFSLPTNGLLRWRILNASPSRFYRLSLENHPFYLIATDGNALAEPVKAKELLLTPGQRVDVLIRGDKKPGQYRLLNLPYNRGGMGMMGGRGMMGGDNNDTSAVIATINYDSPVETVFLPNKLLSVPALPEPKQVRSFRFNHGMRPGVGMAFLINGKSYERERIDTQVKLNTVEDWEIVNTGAMDHTFHLHVNHFQVISRNGTPEPYRAWRDTVLVRQGETVRIRIPFRDFAGKTVYHCHILDHEDLGMMANLEIQ